MDRVMLSVSVANTITIFLMWFVGFIVAAAIITIAKGWLIPMAASAMGRGSNDNVLERDNAA